MTNKPCGAICLNGTVVKGVCDNCIWYAWDDAKKTCSHRCEPICDLYLNDLFSPQSAPGCSLSSARN